MLTLIALAACRPDPTRDLGISVTVSEDVATVVTVSWTTDAPTRGWVEYGDSAQYGLQTNTTATGTEHTVHLLGLRADATVHLRVATDDGALSDDLTVTTGSLPTALPALVVDGDPGAWRGYAPVALIGATNAALIFDSAGEIVWYWMHPEEDGFDNEGGRRVHIDPSGAGVFVNQIGTEGQARLHHVSWDGSVVETRSVPDHNHDFVPHPDGSATALFYDSVEQDDGSLLVADKVARVEADGSVSDLWSAHDDLSPVIAPPAQGSWTHANAVDVVDDYVYVSLRNLSSIARLSAGGTQLDWLIGDPRYGFSDFTFTDGSRPFDGQHQFEFLAEDRLLVFDNNPTLTSRVVEYQLDLDRRVAEQVWVHELDLQIYALGEVARLEDESTFVNMGVLGVLQLIDAEGAMQWRLSSALGYAFGYGVPTETLYSE